MKLPIRAAVAALVTLSLAACVVAAQNQQALRAGARIYVVSRELAEGAAVGQLRFLAPDTISIFVSPVGLVDVSVASIAQLRVSTGRDPKLVYGGPVLGAALGALVGPVFITEPEPCDLGYGDVSDCNKVLPDVVVGAGGGAVIMGILVKLLAKERWVHVRLDQLLSSAVSGSLTLPATIAVWF